jgi:superfamily I DNA/RNA helicase
MAAKERDYEAAKIGDHGLSRLRGLVESELRSKGFNGQITAITAHGSKRLEYDQVLLLDDGSFPIQHPSRPIMQELISEEDFLREEVCLEHVAGTRARKDLVVISM